MTDYEKAREFGLTQEDRWAAGTPHHEMSRRLSEFLVEHDFHDYNDYFCWKLGGDGDNGETLAYQLDAFFELLDCNEKKSSIPATPLDTTSGLKVEISKILQSALNGVDETLRYDKHYIRWGLVEKRIHSLIDQHLNNNNTL